MTRTGVAIATLASLAAATVVTGSVLTRADATDGAQPNTSCATTAACIEGDNTSTGPGVKGTSTKGNGAVGTTKSKGTTAGTDHIGVLGQDLQTGGGKGNVGVEGTSTNGVAILGLSTNSGGVEGLSGNYYGVIGTGATGVVGEGASGVIGFGSNEAVTAQNSTTGDAFLANGFGGLLFRGNNSQSIDVFSIDDGGNTNIAGNVNVSRSVYAFSGGNFGYQFADATGVQGSSDIEAVEGTNASTGDAIYANGFGGLLFRGNNSFGFDVFEVDDNGDVFANSYTSGFAVSMLQRTSIGQTVKTYSPQSTQPKVEDEGEAQLVNGLARVALDPAFAQTMDHSSYMVMVTPEGMTRGVLCVTQRTPAGFVVQENMGGRSTVPFSYRIVARPYGSTAPRLPLATMPAHFDRPLPKKRPAMHVFKPAYHAKPAQKLPLSSVHG